MPLLEPLTVKPLKAALEEFLVEHRIGHSTDKTIKFYDHNLRAFLAVAPATVAEVGRSHVLTYLDKKNTKPYAAAARFRSLRAFFNWCVKQNYCTVNPLDKISRPKLPKPEVKDLSPQDFRRVLDSIPKDTFLGKRNRAMLLMLFDTGMRLEELAQLTIQDLDITEGRVRIKSGKGNRERVVHIGEATRKELWEYLKQHGGKFNNLWLTEERRPGTQRTVAMMMRWLTAKTGIHVNPHQLRHSFAINYLRNGGDVVTLQYLLGHEKIATTMLYLKALGQDDAIRAHKKFSPVDRLL